MREVDAVVIGGGKGGSATRPLRLFTLDLDQDCLEQASASEGHGSLGASGRNPNADHTGVEITTLDPTPTSAQATVEKHGTERSPAHGRDRHHGGEKGAGGHGQPKQLSKFQQRQLRHAAKLYKLSDEFSVAALWQGGGSGTSTFELTNSTGQQVNMAVNLNNYNGNRITTSLQGGALLSEQQIHQQAENSLQYKLKQLRKRYSPRFLALCKIAILNYRAGEWAVAERILEDVLESNQHHDDGPVRAVLEFMRRDGMTEGRMGFHEVVAPRGWAGWRKVGAD